MTKFKNIFKLLTAMFCALLLQACPMDGEFFLYLENNSNIHNDSLAVYTANGFHTVYPDTLLPDKFKDGMLKGGDGKKAAIYFSSSLKDIYKRLPKDTLSVFILDLRSYNRGTLGGSLWTEMNYGKNFLQRYDMSIHDVKLLNYTFPYPPDERMKNMKMYPLYED